MGKGYKTVFVKADELPEESKDHIMRFFSPYSVALNAVVGNDHETFTPIGTGVFVKKGNRYGILTARHCLHSDDHDVWLGIGAKHSLALVIGTGRNAVLSPERVFEHNLVDPVSVDFGPDLTFIEIIPGPSLAAMDALASFYSLDKDSVKLKKRLGRVNTFNVTVGFPQANYKTNKQPRFVEHSLKHMTFFGVIQEGDIYEKDGWDYMESNIFYAENSELPSTFRGVSGGPIWAMKLKKTDQSPYIEIQNWALVGITFLQTAVVGNERRLRAHFINSIYERAWEKLSP